MTRSFFPTSRAGDFTAACWTASRASTNDARTETPGRLNVRIGHEGRVTPGGQALLGRAARYSRWPVAAPRPGLCAFAAEALALWLRRHPRPGQPAPAIDLDQR